jgi:uncharacterized membrane protein
MPPVHRPLFRAAAFARGWGRSAKLLFRQGHRIDTRLLLSRLVALELVAFLPLICAVAGNAGNQDSIRVV